MSEEVKQAAKEENIFSQIDTFEKGAMSAFSSKVNHKNLVIDLYMKKLVAKKAQLKEMKEAALRPAEPIVEEKPAEDEPIIEAPVETVEESPAEPETIDIKEEPIVEVVEKAPSVPTEAVKPIPAPAPVRRKTEFDDIIVKTATDKSNIFTMNSVVPIAKTANTLMNKVSVREKKFVPQQTTTASSDKDVKKKLPEKEKQKPFVKQRDDSRKNLSKKTKVQKGYEENSSAVEYDDSGEVRKIRTKKPTTDKRRVLAPQAIVIDHAVVNSNEITIKQLCDKIGKPSGAIIKKLFDNGVFKNINDTIDFDAAELISAEFGITLELQLEQTNEEKLIAFHEDDTNDDPKDLVTRPPIVTIMGHVDHGKTSILDYIRNSSVASGEAGGITQHIGAYTVTQNGQKITFLDTPGHAAFTAMRARGADVTDIVVIVVAADDGIMPQTIEAINHAKAANVNIIVAVNKMDKPTANPDRVLQQLTEYDILAEEWGGKVPVVRVSAKTGLGIADLLDNILISAELMELKANPKRSAKGTVVEARLDRGKGPVATILVQNGTLKNGDFIVAGTTCGKIRAMYDDKGRQVSAATPSMPVSILGLQDVPNAGDQILVVNDEKLSKQVAEERKNKEKIEQLKKTKKATLEDVFNKIEEGKFKELNLIVKADVQGSVEALKTSLIKLSNDEVKVKVIHNGVGAINETDVMLADTASAIIIGFNIRPDTNAKNLAEKNGIEIKLYKIIYEVIDDITAAIHGLLAPKFVEVYYGRAEVRSLFKASGVGTIAGCYVRDGKIVRNARVRIIRDGKEIFEGRLSSLKRFKDDVKEVLTGFECGLVVDGYGDLKEQDIIEAFMMEEDKE